jgi:outer membrane protein TolC
MENNKYIIVFGFLVSLASILNAQEVKLISKPEVLNKVSEANQSIKIAIEAFNEAKADYRQTNAIFLPNISVSHTGFATTNPLMAFGSKLNQEILTQADFSPSVLNDPSQIQNFSTAIEFQQPLINMDGFYQRKAAKKNMEAMALQTDRLKNYMSYEVENAYMKLQLAYKAVSVLEKALDASEANLKLAQNNFKQGYLQRSDVLLAEIRITEVKNQLQSARSNIRNASNYVSFLMNDTADAILQPSDSLSLDDLMQESKVLIPEERADIKAMQLATDARESLYKSDKMTFLPTLNAFGSYQLYDDEIFQFGADGYLFGAELKWNILEGTKRFGKTRKTRATFEKSKLKYEQYVLKSQLELNKTRRLLTDAQSKLKLTQLAVAQSEEALRIRTNRFEEGLEKTTDLLIAETQYAQKQLEYYQTIFEYNSTKAYLKFLTTY